MEKVTKMEKIARMERVTQAEKVTKAFVSVGICCYNEEKNVGQLLENILTEQGLTQNDEILVICSGCTDSTPEIVREFCDKDKRIKLIMEPTRNGKAPALNILLNTYLGDFFIHLDADHLPSHGAFQLLMKNFDDENVGAVSGCQIPFRGDKFIDKIGEVTWGLHNETQRYCNDKKIAQHLGGVLFAIRRGICDCVPEDVVNDDAYMGVECVRKGYVIRFEESALAHFFAPRTMRDYIIQRRRVVYGHLKVGKQTGISPMVLEMCPLKHKVKIIYHWTTKNWQLLPFFISALALELYVNTLARLDYLKVDNPHKIWKIAESTK